MCAAQIRIAETIWIFVWKTEKDDVYRFLRSFGQHLRLNKMKRLQWHLAGGWGKLGSSDRNFSVIDASIRDAKDARQPDTVFTVGFWIFLDAKSKGHYFCGVSKVKRERDINSRKSNILPWGDPANVSIGIEKFHWNKRQFEYGVQNINVAANFYLRG